MQFVRTVLGDIEPQQMGLTYSHEHVVIKESFATVTNPDFVLNDTEKITAELKEFFSMGGRTLVDTMPANCGRSARKLAEVSKASGVNIIMPTGIHLEIYYPPNHWRYHLTEDQLTDLFIQDIIAGVDEFDYGCPVVKRTSHRAGLIKLATGNERITPHQEKIFRAVVNAHRETGAPILTHTTNGLLATDQAKMFIRLGADPAHIVLSHVDRNRDLGYHRELMEMGVYVEYDSHFRWKEGAANWTFRLLEELLPDYAGQIVIGMDMARNSYWRSYGGRPGLTYLLTSFREELESMGLGKYFNTMFVENPQKLFAFGK